MARGELQPGFTFDEYEIVREIGRGGMGVVYLALDAHERQVAIKTLKFARTVGPSEELRFKNEIRILHSIDHVNVVRFFKAGRLEGTTGGSVLWVALEHLAGPSLRDVIDERPGRVDPEDVIRWSKQIAEGLSVAHSLGVTHRDLKPANVKFDGNTIKVIDFGIAAARDIGGLTASDAAIGTLGYMAPEQLDSRIRVDARADVFALGIIMYELATGRHPLAGDGEPPTTSELIARMLMAEVPALHEVVPAIPEMVSAIAARAMRRDRDQRFASMLEMRKALDGAMRAYRGEHRPLLLGELSGNFEPLLPLSALPPQPPTPAPSDPGGAGGWRPQQLATVRVETPDEARSHPRAAPLRTEVSEGAAPRAVVTVPLPQMPELPAALDATQAMDGPPVDAVQPHRDIPRTISGATVTPPVSKIRRRRLAALIGAAGGVLLGLAFTTSLRAIAGAGAGGDDGPAAAASAPAADPPAADPTEAPRPAAGPEAGPAPPADAEASARPAATASAAPRPLPPPAAPPVAPAASNAPRPVPPPVPKVQPPPPSKVLFGKKPEF